MRDFYVYIMCSESGTLYTGVTNNLERRAEEHKRGIVPGFTKRYNITRLVYYETLPDINEAIDREKQIKSWRRRKKLDLIVSMNPRWLDLVSDWYSERPDRIGVRPLAEPVLSASEGLGVTNALNADEDAIGHSERSEESDPQRYASLPASRQQALGVTDA